MTTDIDLTTMRMSAESLRTEEGRKKVAQEGGDYIRDHMREWCFADKIIPPQPVTVDELRPGITEGSTTAVPGDFTDDRGDTVFAHRDIQVSGKAMLLNFRGEPRAHFINGKRYAIPLATVSTERFEKTEGELIASRYDILSVIEDTAFLETHRERDRKFLEYCDAAVAANQQGITANGPLQRSVFRDIKHPAIRNELKPQVVLLSEAAFTDLDLWDQSDLGDTVASVTADGYTATKVGNMTFIVSIKRDLFDTWNGNSLASTKIYSFPAAKFLGHNLYYGDYKVWSEWEGELWRFQGWQRFGMGFGNINGVTRMTVTY